MDDDNWDDLEVDSIRSDEEAERSASLDLCRRSEPTRLVVRASEAGVVPLSTSSKGRKKLATGRGEWSRDLEERRAEDGDDRSRSLEVEAEDWTGADG